MGNCQALCGSAATPGSTAWVACMASCPDEGVYIPDSGIPVFMSEVTGACPTPWFLIVLISVLSFYLGKRS